ncbi:MAG TPA: hypothetical protein VFQ27_05465 [Xanthobacteraceae bacterium]|nr:hypothetical protein [Xanthobacteraceae bacterium]
MSGRRLDLTRMVLALSQGGHDRERMDAIGELAELLHLEIQGLLFEDPGLRALAGHTFARELRTIGPAWSPVEATRLAEEMEGAAEALRRRFFGIFGRRRLKTHFEVARQSAAAAFGTLRPGDVLVLVEPVDPVELACSHLAPLPESAETAGAVLIVPAPLVRRRGPVVAIAAESGDSSIELALTIAAAAGERLIVLSPPARDAERAASAAERSLMPVAVEEIPFEVARARPADIASRLAGVNERLIVASRTRLDRTIGAAAASLLRVPVLLTGNTSD